MHIIVPSGGCKRGDSIEGFLYKEVILDKCKNLFFFPVVLAWDFWFVAFFLVCLSTFFFLFLGGRGQGFFFLVLTGKPDL